MVEVCVFFFGVASSQNQSFFSRPKYDHSPPKVRFKRGITLAALITLAESSFRLSLLANDCLVFQDFRNVESAVQHVRVRIRDPHERKIWSTNFADGFNSWGSTPLTPPKEHYPIGGPTGTETKCNERVKVKASKKTPRVSRLDESYCQRVSICKEKRVAEGGWRVICYDTSCKQKDRRTWVGTKKRKVLFF